MIGDRLLIKAHLRRCLTRQRSSRTTKYAAVFGSQAPCIWDLSQQPVVQHVCQRNTTNILYYKSPIGVLAIHGSEEGITSIYFCTKRQKNIHVSENGVGRPLHVCLKQLKEYFEGKRKSFSVPLKMEGTPFQKKVWRQLEKIPYGKTSSYLGVAKGIRNPRAARAVGGANGRNRFPIIIPCHRVIAHDGSWGGYSSGLARKRWLLRHEGVSCAEI